MVRGMMSPQLLGEMKVPIGVEVIIGSEGSESKDGLCAVESSTALSLRPLS